MNAKPRSQSKTNTSVEIEDRLVELTMQIWRDSNFDNVFGLAEGCGYQPKWDGETLHIHGLVRTALPRDADPITMFVILGFAFLGQRWIDICPGGLSKVNKIWKENTKQKVKI